MWNWVLHFGCPARMHILSYWNTFASCWCINVSKTSWYDPPTQTQIGRVSGNGRYATWRQGLVLRTFVWILSSWSNLASRETWRTQHLSNGEVRHHTSPCCSQDLLVALCIGALSAFSLSAFSVVPSNHPLSKQRRVDGSTYQVLVLNHPIHWKFPHHHHNLRLRLLESSIGGHWWTLSSSMFGSTNDSES